MINLFHTAPATVVAAIQDAIGKHGTVAVTFDRDGDLHMGPAGGDVMRAYETNHPDLLVMKYTRQITARDLLADIAGRLDELSTYGRDKNRRKR